VDEIGRLESSRAEKRPRVVECHENHHEAAQAVDRYGTLARRR
jgi:hypothetical protein